MTSQASYQNLVDTLAALKTSFDDFKDTYRERLEQVEITVERQQKISPRPVRVASEPPALPSPDQHKITESKQFSSFLRSGSLLSKKSLVAGEDPGSFTLPLHVQSRLQSDLEVAGSFRSLARTLSISSSFVDIVVDAGLPEARWVEEQGAREETRTANFLRKRIMTHELYAKPSATQKLLDDAQIDIENWLVEKVSRTMRQMENKSFLFGAGDHEPKGIFSYESQKTPARNWGVFQEIQTGFNGDFYDNKPNALMDIMHALPSQYLDGAAWAMSPQTLARIRSLRNIEGRALYDQAHDSPFGMKLFGYPIFLFDDLPNLEIGVPAKGIIFGNFKEAYQIVDRQDFQILRDPYSNKPYIEFYIYKRVGGDVINFEALKILNFSSGEGSAAAEGAASGGDDA
jgi:HK97 family phage major capsid protein